MRFQYYSITLVLLGIGLCMIYMPAVLVVGFYFERWRALATGLALCGSGVGTFVLSPLTNYLLTSYSWNTTLVIHAGAPFLVPCLHHEANLYVCVYLCTRLLCPGFESGVLI